MNNLVKIAIVSIFIKQLDYHYYFITFDSKNFLDISLNSNVLLIFLSILFNFELS